MKKEKEYLIKENYLHLGLFVIILFFFLMGNLSLIPEKILSFFPIILVFVIPLEVGYFISLFYRKIRSKDLVSSSILRLPFLFGLGTISLFIISTILDVLGIFNFLFLLLVFQISTFFNFFLTKKEFIKIKHNSLLVFLCVFIFSTIFFIFLREKSPFPLQPIWDQFVYSFSSARMISFNEFHLFSHNFSPEIYKLSSFPFFSFLIAFSSFILNINPINLFWISPLFLSFIYGLIIYKFAYVFTSKKGVAILASFISIWVTETVHVNEITSFVTATFFMLAFPFFFIYIYENKKIPKKDYFPLIFIGIFFALFHIFEFFPLIFFVSFYFIIKKINLPRFFTTLSILFLSGIFIFLSYFQINLPFDFFGRRYLFPLHYKLAMINNWYGIFFFFSLLTILFIFFSREDIKRSSFNDFKIFSMLFLSICIIFFLNFSGSMRIIPYLHPFIALFSAYLIISSSCFFKNKLKFIVLFILLFIVIINSIFSINFLISTYDVGGDYSSSFSKEDIHASKFISENIQEDTFILSSPGQQIIISGLTGSYSYGSLEGDLSNFMKEILRGEDVRKSHNLICNVSINSEDKLLIISGRSQAWANNQRKIPFYTPKNLTLKDKEIIKKFISSPLFETIYSNEQIYIFKINDCK